MRRARATVAPLLAALLGLASCVSELSPTPTPTVPASSASPTATPGTPTPATTETAALTPSPTPTATPALALPDPASTDERRVRTTIETAVPADGDGTITVTVVSLADAMVDELVLRWPEELHATLFPAPFVPSEDRIRDGGPPLVQPWTKWVVGPGERGEPAGTVSLGYGPLPAGGSLEIVLHVTRRAPGPVTFELQVLAGEALLTGEDGAPAELRIEVP